MSVEGKRHRPGSLLIPVVLFALLAAGGLTGEVKTVGVGWVVLAFAAWRNYDGQPVGTIWWIVGALVVVVPLAALLFLGIRLP